ncbi:hypothetical protein LINPERHAP1_LOCUS13241, partial [Linum perenne]
PGRRSELGIEDFPDRSFTESSEISKSGRRKHQKLSWLQPIEASCVARSFYVGDAASRNDDHSDADIKFAHIYIDIMNRSRQNYVAPGVLNKYSKKPVSFKSFSSSSKLTKSSKLPTKRQEYPAKRQELTSDGANVQPHLLHTRGRNHNNEILQEIVAEMNEEINVEMNEEINPEIDAEMIEVVDLQIREDFLNEETLSERIFPKC